MNKHHNLAGSFGVNFLPPPVEIKAEGGEMYVKLDGQDAQDNFLQKMGKGFKTP